VEWTGHVSPRPQAMKHAGQRALDALQPLLKELRAIPGLVERKRGVFYCGATAFLHFHEDPTGFFADLKCDGDFERYPVNTPAESARLLRSVRAAVGTVKSAG